MAIVVRFDKQAIEHLLSTWPEETKVELRTKVLDEVIRKQIRINLDTDIMHIIRGIAKEELKLTVGDGTFTLDKKYWPTPLNPAFLNAVRTEVRQDLQAQLEETINNEIKEYLTTALKPMLDTLIEKNGNILLRQVIHSLTQMLAEKGI